MLDAMSLSWFCGALEGELVGFMELAGGFFWDMALCGSFVTCCIGFQILYMCSSYAWSEDGCHSGMSYCAYHWHSVLYFHQARRAAEKFCSRGKATVLPENVLRIASCHGLAFTILSVVTQ